MVRCRYKDHTQLLVTAQKDLHSVFRRIRMLKQTLSKEHPEAFQGAPAPRPPLTHTSAHTSRAHTCTCRTTSTPLPLYATFLEQCVLSPTQNSRNQIPPGTNANANANRPNATWCWLCTGGVRALQPWHALRWLIARKGEQIVCDAHQYLLNDTGPMLCTDCCSAGIFCSLLSFLSLSLHTHAPAVAKTWNVPD